MNEPTTEDMARDLAADLADNEASDPDGSSHMNSGCNEYRCGCHYALPAAIRRALAAEARVKVLELHLRQRVEMGER